MYDSIETVENYEHVASEYEPKLYHFACKKFGQNKVTCNRILTDEEVAVLEPIWDDEMYDIDGKPKFFN